MSTSTLPPSGGYPDQPQGEVCPPVSTGGGDSFKTCRVCGLSKEIAEFRRRKVCRACEHEYLKAWRKHNADKVNEYSAKAYHLYPQSDKAKHDRWRKANPERARAVNVRWQHRNPQRNKIGNAVRRARLAKARVGDVKELQEFYASVQSAPVIPCYLCGENTTPDNRHVDHVIPLCKNGSHSVENLAVACATCNLKKGGRI